MVVAVFAGAAAVFNDDAFVVIVDVERDKFMAVASAAAVVDDGDGAGCRLTHVRVMRFLPHVFIG